MPHYPKKGRELQLGDTQTVEVVRRVVGLQEDGPDRIRVSWSDGTDQVVDVGERDETVPIDGDPDPEPEPVAPAPDPAPTDPARP